MTHTRSRHPVAWSVLGVVCLLAAPRGQQIEPLDLVLNRLGLYLLEYEGELSTVVASEHYEQQELRVPRRARGPMPTLGDVVRTRKLESDVAFLRLPGGASWLGLRDVLRVDGRAVTTDATRLLALVKRFGRKADLDDAARITAASSLPQPRRHPHDQHADHAARTAASGPSCAVRVQAARHRQDRRQDRPRASTSKSSTSRRSSATLRAIRSSSTARRGLRPRTAACGARRSSSPESRRARASQLRDPIAGGLHVQPGAEDARAEGDVGGFLRGRRAWDWQGEVFELSSIRHNQPHHAPALTRGLVIGLSLPSARPA